MVLSSHEGNSNAALSATLSDKFLSDWEELLSCAQICYPCRTLHNNTGYKYSAVCRCLTIHIRAGGPPHCLSSCFSLRATRYSLARSWANPVLARQSCFSAPRKDTLWASIDGSSLFGRDFAQTPSLRLLLRQTPPLLFLLFPGRHKMCWTRR